MKYTFIQSIFVNKVVTVGWVKTRGEESLAPEANGGFGAELLVLG